MLASDGTGETRMTAGIAGAAGDGPSPGDFENGLLPARAGSEDPPSTGPTG
jgi:hypothetical protein